MPIFGRLVPVPATRASQEQPIELILSKMGGQMRAHRLWGRHPHATRLAYIATAFVQAVNNSVVPVGCGAKRAGVRIDG